MKIKGRVRKAQDELKGLSEALMGRDWANARVEFLHLINKVFHRNESDSIGINRNPITKMGRRSEIETLSSVWLSDEDKHEMEWADRELRRGMGGLTRGSRLTSSSALPVDPAPAATTDEAVKLVSSGKYKWVIRNDIMCLIETDERPKLRVLPSAISVTRL